MATDNRPTLLAKIDWYSFTIPLAAGLSGTGIDTLEAINFQLAQLPLPGVDPVSADGTWRVVPARGFYEFRATHLLSGLAVSWGAVNAHLFVELAGSSCDYFRHAGKFIALVDVTAIKASRVDAAVDILTDTRPATFVRAGFADRFKFTHGHIVSETGETLYVGNRKSDRSARVYRYNPPHPRAAFLRVEAEFKGTAARSLALVLSQVGELEACVSAHKIFGWKSKELTLDFLALLSLKRDHRTNPATGNTDGLTPVSYPRSLGISRRVLLTLDAGWLRWYYRRSRPRLTPDIE